MTSGSFDGKGSRWCDTFGIKSPPAAWSRLWSRVVGENKKAVVNCWGRMKLNEMESVSKGDKMSLLQEKWALKCLRPAELLWKIRHVAPPVTGITENLY